MANNCTLTSLAIARVTVEEAEWLRRQWRRLRCGIDPAEKKEPNDFEIPEELVWWDLHLMIPSGCDENGETSAFIYNDEGFNADWLCAVLSDFLKWFRPDGVIHFSWAETCSKPRPDEFGGGAAIVRAGEWDSMSTYGWLEKQLQRPREEHQHFEGTCPTCGQFCACSRGDGGDDDHEPLSGDAYWESIAPNVP